MEFSIRQISASETVELRQNILRPHQALSECVYPHDETPETFHLGAFVNEPQTSKERLIGIASFLYDPNQDLPDPESQYRIRGMATQLDFRRLGIGTAMLNEGLSILKEKKAKRVWCNARETAFAFYEKSDFIMLGEMFYLPGIGPHKVFWREV